MSGRPSSRRLLPALRLRHKLGISLVIAALLPVLVVSWVAVSVVLRGLDRGVHDDTSRQLHVGLNLLLRNVERLGQEAVRVASSERLAQAVVDGPKAVADVLAREEPHLPSALIQVTDRDGVVQAQRVVGGVLQRFEGVGAAPGSRSVQAGTTYERRVTIVRVDGALVVRAVAPVVDPSFRLRGVVVVSVPLDGVFADGLKAALGTDVLLFAGTDAGAVGDSTFLDPVGARQGGIRLPASVAAPVGRGESAFRQARIGPGEYAVGYAPVMNLDGEVVGVFGVAVDRAPVISAEKAATRSLALGTAGALVFALGLAGLLSRRITNPLQRLHQGAVAIARGDLDHRIRVPEGDEIGDLATAFAHMTRALEENQRRLAARMREIVALHDAGRAVSSVLELDQVLRKVVDSVARVLHVRVCALWLVKDGGDEPVLELGAGRAKRVDMRTIDSEDEIQRLVQPLESIAREVARTRANLRIDELEADPLHREAARQAGIEGSLVATALERKGSVVGVIIIGRGDNARSFSEADANLLATFADQAATAIENASLYAEVRAFNEELEAKVELRTGELTAMNDELGRAITELRETQSQLILSERLAGLGQLVAGVAHEINSPSAAIRGTADALEGNVRRFAELSRRLAAADWSDAERERLAQVTATLGPELAARRRPAPAAVRRTGRTTLVAALGEAGIADEAVSEIARSLAELGVGADVDGPLGELLAVVAPPGRPDAAARARLAVDALSEHVYLHRATRTIQDAIRRIQRIVGSLKSYSHLDQEASRTEADLHEGIENTIAILDHVLARGILVRREYGEIPSVPVYVDELNQVWTNLIHNAVQALEGEGTISIETTSEAMGVVVRVIDDGPGIAPEVLPRIFEPFFTTKPQGEGTGLGLGIVRQIVDKHGGRVRCDSRPGRTCFEVWLPAGEESA